MNPLALIISALVASTPAPQHAAAEDPSLCFRAMPYTNFQIPIPCTEISSLAEARASARLLPTGGDGRVPVYFARCSVATGDMGCRANRLGTDNTSGGAGLAWDNAPLGYAFDPARERPVGSNVLIECHEHHERGYIWGSTITADIWHYMVADDQSEAANCQQYWGRGSYTGQVIGYVYPVS